MHQPLIDLWRRMVPGHPRYANVAFYSSHRELPAELPRRQLALVGGSREQPKWAAFECPCGSGHRILLALSSQASPRWRIDLSNPRRPSLHPSVDSASGRRCHFWLGEGRVRWVPGRRRGRRARLADR